jgi:hypothetical protein
MVRHTVSRVCAQRCWCSRRRVCRPLRVQSDSDDYEPSVPSDEDGPDDAAADWDSDADEGVVAQCLFCPLRSPAAAVVGHMAEAHHFTCKDVVRAGTAAWRVRVRSRAGA